MWKGPLVCWRNAFANIPCWILHAPIDVRSVFDLSVMHPVRVLIVRYMFVCCPSLIRRHFACWIEAVRCIFVTCTFQPFHVRCMYVCSFGFSTGLTFSQPDNKNSYPFHVRKFNPVKCDRGFKFVITNSKIRYNEFRNSLYRIQKFVVTNFQQQKIDMS